MAKFIFKGTAPSYYTESGVFAEPGKTYELPSAPDANWAPADETTSNPAPAPAADAVAAAEALLEANPALAEKIIGEAAQNA